MNSTSGGLTYLIVIILFVKLSQVELTAIKLQEASWANLEEGI
jgi:hypothetical protein